MTSPINPALPVVPNPGQDVWGVDLNADLAAIIAALNTVIVQYAPLSWTPTTLVSSANVTAGNAVRLSTTTGPVTATLTTATGNGLTRVRVKWIAGTGAPTVTAATGTVLDPTWTGFGQLGDSADFALDTTQTPPVWQLV